MKFHIGWLFAASLVLSSCATAPELARVATATPPLVTVAPHLPTACPVCGRVERIEIIQGVRATERGGVVLGGVVGGVLSNPATSPSSTPPSNPAKPVAGVTARPSPPTYRLTLHMADGRRLVIHQNLISPNLHVGSLVRVDNGRVLLLR